MTRPQSSAQFDEGVRRQFSCPFPRVLHFERGASFVNRGRRRRAYGCSRFMRPQGGYARPPFAKGERNPHICLCCLYLPFAKTARGSLSDLERPGGSSPCCRGGRLCVPRGPIGEHIEGFTVTGWFVLFIKPLRQEGAARFLAHDIHVNLPHVSAAPLSAQRRRQKSRHETHAI